MKVFKFGGASIKDADGVRNLAKIIEGTKEQHLIVVVSAMGKTTNALEKVVSSYFSEPSMIEANILSVYDYHQSILVELFRNPSHPVFDRFKELIGELRAFLKATRSKNHAFVYDQIVSFGELLSTTIISEYFKERELVSVFLDVRTCIRTNTNYRDALVDWDLTQRHIKSMVDPQKITITQGFLGSETSNNFTTTLGREGSDYTAAIFAYCLNAESVTIWKDVPGVLNADPRYFSDPILLRHISYKEAIELAFYGASVIHPKTLQPLQRKEIPLYVKSFLQPFKHGTHVGKGVSLEPITSCFILKKNQVLLSISSLDFSFIMEKHIGDVFKLLDFYKMKVGLIQNSAISFSVCIENKYDTLNPLLTKLRESFKVKWNEGVTLLTVRHSRPSEIEKLTRGKEVLLKQESRETVQIIVRE